MPIAKYSRNIRINSGMARKNSTIAAAGVRIHAWSESRAVANTAPNASASTAPTAKARRGGEEALEQDDTPFAAGADPTGLPTWRRSPPTPTSSRAATR
jgi:hypothetical protein